MEIGLECLLKKKEHALLLYSWRSDEEAARMSLHRYKDVDDFWPTFSSRYFLLKDLPSCFATLDGKRVAFVGFDPVSDHEKKCAMVSIVVAPESRGKGIGTNVLQAVSDLALQQGYDALLAEIKPENSASKHLFEKAGYKQHKSYTKQVEGQNVPLMLFTKELTLHKKRKPVFIIAEAGSNWRMGNEARDLKMAKTLIESAKEAGCDAIKFQTYRAHTVYAPDAGKSDYLSDSGFVEDIHSIFEDLSMPYEMFAEIAKMCADSDIECMSSAFSKADFEAIDPYVKRHKIASYEISHVRLLELAAKSKKPLILSTGASTPDDIAFAISYFRQCGGSDLTLLQCSAQYPANPKAMNLRAIAWMKSYFGLDCGLSDHSRDPLYAPIAAVALGATVIEKHFTIDRRLIGPDHAFAIEPDELKQMVEAIRTTEAMLGSGIKQIEPDEEELFSFARRRIQALKELKKGDRFVEDENVAILRPGKQKPGVHPKFMDELSGHAATRHIKRGEGIQPEDWK